MSQEAMENGTEKVCVCVLLCMREKEVTGGRKTDWQREKSEPVMEIQSDRNALLVHPACLGDRKRESKPEDMVTHMHTHTHSHATNAEAWKTSFADLLVNRALSHTLSCKVCYPATL